MTSLIDHLLSDSLTIKCSCCCTEIYHIFCINLNHLLCIVEDVKAAANEFPRGAVGGIVNDEDHQMEHSIGIAGPLPMMPPGQLPLSSVSVDNIPKGVEAGCFT